MAAATDAMLQGWDHLQAYAFPPVAVIRAVLNKTRSSVGAEITVLANEGVVPRSVVPAVGTSDPPSVAVGYVPSASCQKVPSKVNRSSSSCMETRQRHARAARFSARVARQLSCSRRSSPLAAYQFKWSIFCH